MQLSNQMQNNVWFHAATFVVVCFNILQLLDLPCMVTMQTPIILVSVPRKATNVQNNKVNHQIENNQLKALTKSNICSLNPIILNPKS
jgi:hypothetical protein